MLTDACGEVDIEVPRDRDGSFAPVAVPQAAAAAVRRRRGRAFAVSKGLTTGEMSPHFAEVYSASLSQDTVTRITERVNEEMQTWWSRPLGASMAIVIDANMVKICNGQVLNCPVYAAIGVDLDGYKDILGMRAGDGDGESAKFWMAGLTELKNRAVKDVFFVVCDGLKACPPA